MIGCARDVLEPDEFNTVGVAGEPQSISAHEKLRSTGKCKKKKKKEKEKKKTVKKDENQVVP